MASHIDAALGGGVRAIETRSPYNGLNFCMKPEKYRLSSVAFGERFTASLSASSCLDTMPETGKETVQCEQGRHAFSAWQAGLRCVLIVSFEPLPAACDKAGGQPERRRMYANRVKHDLARWVEAGLLPAETAAALVRDLESRGGRFGIAQFLAILAAVFLCAALLLVISANWEAIPRIARLMVLVGLIWACHLGAAFLFRAGRATLAAAALLLGTASFGGGLSLSAQMYHVSGDTVSFFAVWFAAAAFTAVVFRSGAVTVAAGMLAFALCWAIVTENEFAFSAANLGVPPLLAVVMAALSRWSGQEKAAHFSFLLLIGWALWFYSRFESVLAAGAFAAIGFGLFVLLAARRSPLSRFGDRLSGAPVLYALLFSAIGFMLLHLSLSGGALVMAAAAGFLVSVAALALGGHEHGGVRWLSYAMIASIVFYLWVETIGSILGTSGFFLAAALVAGALAFAVVRLEKRFASARRVS